MAEKTYTNLGPIYLTSAKFKTLKDAGQLEAGREYKLVDWEAQEKLTAGNNITIDEYNVITAVDTIYDDTTVKADIAGLKDGTIYAGKAVSASTAMNYAEGGSISAALQSKQATLVSGTNIKTVNGSSIVGEGNVEVKTYQPFPDNKQLSGTLQEVVTEIMKFPTKAQGMAYLGMIRGESTPFGYGNVECTVTFMTSTIALLSVSSSNIYPYHWEYNTYQGDYKWRSFIIMPDKPSDFDSSTYVLKFVNGTATWVKE